MLQATGKVLDVQDRIVNGPSGDFASCEVAIMTGKAEIERVRLGRDFPNADKPREGEDVTLNVVVSAYASKSGARVQMTALSRHHAGEVVGAGKS